jgi:branched-chain amino acid transport system substrate-binding protein
MKWTIGAGLAWSIWSAAMPPAEANAPKPYTIDVIISLTGGGAFLGREEHDALALAEPTFNKLGGIHGRPIHFAFHDDQSSPQVAVQLMAEIVSRHPALVLGSTLVANCNAMQPFVKNGPVLYCLSAGVHPAPGSYMFTSGTSTYDQAASLVQYFHSRGWDRLALMTSTDATGQDADRAFDTLLGDSDFKSVKMVARTHFNPTDINVDAQLQTIKEAAPQAFIGWATGSPSATIFRDAKQMGLQMPTGTTGGNMTYDQMAHFAAFLPQHFYLPTSEWLVGKNPGIELAPSVEEQQLELHTAFQSAGKKPDEGSVLGWDPAAIIFEALRALPDGVTASQLHAYLVHLKGQAGVSGVYDFEKSPQRGLSKDNVVVTEWNAAAGAWTPVSGPAGKPFTRHP